MGPWHGGGDRAMCDAKSRFERSKTPPRPRWSRLYLVAGVMLGVLLIVQALVSAGSERTALQCSLVLAGFGVMAQWARRNRAALDHLDWCACASAQTTIRVIPSGRAHPRYADPLPWVDAPPVERVPLEAIEEIVRERIAGARLS
jgi:hypothetical protein